MLSQLFASAPAMPDAVTWAGFTGCFAFLMWMVKMFLEIKDRATGKATAIQQPLVVKEDSTALTKKEFEAYCEREREEKKEMMREIREDLHTLGRERSQSTAGLYRKMDQVEAQLRTDLSAQMKSLTETTTAALKDANHNIIEQGQQIAALRATIAKK